MKISAFMPVTNAIKRGDTFIEAILSHLYWADELVVVDGGSTDGTVEAIRALNQPAIRIIERMWPQDDWSWAEFCKAWNAGLEAATGDWVAAGESDHIFHQDDAERIRREIQREQDKGKAVVKCQKLQCGSYLNWYSKAQMYYFIHKAEHPNIKYGFDPIVRTDLCQPIWHDGEYYEDLPKGNAIIVGSQYQPLIGGTGVPLYNYVWTFKTLDMIMTERVKANRAWNRFSGFTAVYNVRKREGHRACRDEVIRQVQRVREQCIRMIPLDLQPGIMHEPIRTRLRDDMVGSPAFSWE